MSRGRSTLEVVDEGLPMLLPPLPYFFAIGLLWVGPTKLVIVECVAVVVVLNGRLCPRVAGLLPLAPVLKLAYVLGLVGTNGGYRAEES